MRVVNKRRLAKLEKAATVNVVKHDPAYIKHCVAMHERLKKALWIVVDPTHPDITDEDIQFINETLVEAERF